MSLDKFYTKPFIADYYSNIVLERYGNVEYIEPCAGNGAFLNILPIKGYDILPEREDIIQQDIFELAFKTNQVVVSNPPFGKNSSLAIKVFNHIAKHNVKAICFIVPKTFKKISCQNKLNLNYKIVFEQDVISNAYTEDNINKDVKTVFQIWERVKKPREIIKMLTTSEYFDFVEEDYDVCVRRTGGRAGQVVPHSTTTYNLKVKDLRILTALRVYNYEKYINNTAGVRSISKHELIIELENTLRRLI